MTTASVVVPLAGDASDRHANWKWLERRYVELHPDYALVVQHGPADADFAKGVLVNRAVAALPRWDPDVEVLVLADADCVVDGPELERCVEAVAEGEAAWAVPFRDVYRLNSATTNVTRAGPVYVRPCPVDRAGLDPLRPMYRGKAGGGVVVLAKYAFESIGGYDPGFAGWGGEDYSLGYALTACFGRPHRSRTPLWHLWHEPAPGYNFEGKLPAAARELQGRYRRASGDAATMRALLADRSRPAMG